MESKRRRDDIIVIVTVITVAVAAIAGSRYAWFRLFFSWPSGGTWSNTIAWLEDDAIALLAIWYFRGHLRPHITAWWHDLNKHHAEALRNHVSSEIEALEMRLRSEMASHHAKIADIVRNSNSGADGSAHD